MSDTARHAEIKRRYARKPKIAPTSLATIRVNELTKLFRARHGYQLPNTTAGRDHAAIMCSHLAECAQSPARRIDNWLSLWCPWLTVGEAAAIRAECIDSPKRWKAKTLGFRLRLTDTDRTTLGIRTIAAVDITPEAQTQRRKDKARLRAQQWRAKHRKQTRAQYLASIKATTKPWLELGISRAAWYSRQRANPK